MFPNLDINYSLHFTESNNPPASKASREVANLTERKNPHTPVYGVKEFVCLSVTKFDPNYHRTGKTEVCYFGCQSCFCKPFFQKQLIFGRKKLP